MTPAPPRLRDERNLGRVLTHQRIDLVLDIGANVGQYALRLRAAGYRGRIVSFEPQASTHRKLADAARHDPDWTVAPPLAIGARDGPAMLHVSGESDMSSLREFTGEMCELLDSAAFIATEEVRLARLDGVFGEYAAPGARVLLKSDTQGGDREVLDGASGVLERVHAIQIELAIVAVYRGEPTYREMIDHLAELGFHPVLFIPGYFNRRTARLIAMDGVFVRTV